MNYFALVINNIRSRKLRAFLTLIGIIIGISAIILLYSFADSMESVVSDQFNRMGSNKIVITSRSLNIGSMFNTDSGLYESDAELIESIKGVKFLLYYYSTKLPVEIHKKTKVLDIMGVDTKNAEDFYKEYDVTAETGRVFYKNEKNAVALLGSNINKKFDSKIYPKNIIKIKNQPFRVIGIIKTVGNQQLDNIIRIPIDKIRELTDTTTELSGIMVSTLQGVDVDDVAEAIRHKLKRKKGNENFLVMTQNQLKEKANKILGVIKLVVLAIAFISLLVGAIGIMNTMYNAVLQRIPEIGIMKSIGATNKDILLIFLEESSFFGLIGGFISIVLSKAIILLVNNSLQSSIHINLKLSLMLFALIFSLIIGILSGLFPAYKATKYKPIDALHYE